MKKRKSAARGKNAGARRIKVQNRVAMISISMVVCMLVEITTEEARTKDIEDMQEYMQSDEYAEKIAKEKIGLVKDNEIIFKENK